MDLDTTAMAATTTPAIVTEAGSREAPALPPGLLTESGEAGGRPTKLFIGGISRHTTTKQLRDHFSQFGRVLDCVAMRQPDGRPRGFGYVTLDSPTAADRCLREPQMIDNRIVDMKLAVPEGSASGQTSPSQASYTPKMFPGQADYHMGMLGGLAYGGWPETSGAFCNPSLLWAGGKTSPASQGLDCADLLTAARELSQASQPHGLPLHSVGARDYGEFALDPLDALGAGNQLQSTLIPEEFQQPVGGKMSASAPEFVPSAAQAPRQQKSDAADTPANPVGTATPHAQKPRSRAPLGELTNIVVEVGDLLKPFESPTTKSKLAGMAHGHLSNTSQTEPAGISNRLRPQDLLLGDDVESSSPSSSSDAHLAPTSPDSSSPEPETANPTVEAAENAAAAVEARVEDQTEAEKKEEVETGPASPAASNEDESSGEGSSGDEAIVQVDLDSLPSMGSAAHATGECKRCNFFPKGRCQNGKNCTFCHYPHDKRKPSRQEKRERRAAWLEQQDPQDAQQLVLQEEAMQRATGPLLSNRGLQPGCFPVYTDEDIFSGETLAYSIFPGLPPIHATKLPAPLPLPGMDMPSRANPALPPGLAPPGTLTTQPWQPEAETSPAAQSLLSTGHTMPGVFDGSCVQQVVSTTMRTSMNLSTVPTPLRTSPPSTAASTPMPTPMATPTAAVTAASAEARSTGSLLPPVTMTTSTSGTQTGDYMCNKCEAEFQENSATGDINTNGTKARFGRGKQGHQYSREELLRLRDGFAKASDTGKAKLVPHTVAITACPSI